MSCDKCAEMEILKNDPIQLKLHMQAEVAGSMMKEIIELKAQAMKLAEALKFYASPWGPHQGSPINNVNKFTQNRLNETCEDAIKALAEWNEFLEKQK